MTWTCHSICKTLSTAKKERYELGNQLFCSVCSKMFVISENPGPRCLCCNNKMRHKSKRKNYNK